MNTGDACCCPFALEPELPPLDLELDPPEFPFEQPRPSLGSQMIDKILLIWLIVASPLKALSITREITK